MSEHHLKKPNFIRALFTNRKLVLYLFDLLCYTLAFVTSYVVTYLWNELTFAPLPIFLWNFAITFFIVILVRTTFGIYSTLNRYPDVKIYCMTVISDLMSGVLVIIVTILLKLYLGFWYTFTLVALYCLMTLSSRFFYVIIRQEKKKHDQPTDLHKIGVAIVGAGQVGTLLADDLNLNPNSHYKPVCFIDTDRTKIGNSIGGINVYEENEDIIDIIKQMPVQEIFIALPQIDGETAKSLLEFYRRTGCKVKLYDFTINEKLEKSSGKRVMREFGIEDLLRREEQDIRNSSTFDFYRDKVVIVTGGGGSIGSELCRQIAKCSPRQLIILDIYENNAYDIQQELIRMYGDALDLRVEIASVRDRARLEAVFNYYRPQIVFHAAAHKHVPLMEHSNCEAIKNNICGTYNTADMAEKYGVEKFILVSTDKAVNPTNIMGASKRMCEMVVQCRYDSATSFAAVRFGNVLGSNGSVIPLFRRQIENGGPVTLTDKRIIRYFMTIPEASKLLMQAGSMAKSGQLFVLNMGKPVKILELAENMIRLSGHIPYEDIDIVEVGLRPGEKLYEELLIRSETLSSTENDTIFIENDTPLSREEVDARLKMLMDTVRECEGEIHATRIKDAMKQAVPTYRDPEEVNAEAEQSEEMHQAEEGSAEQSDAPLTNVNDNTDL